MINLSQLCNSKSKHLVNKHSQISSAPWCTHLKYSCRLASLSVCHPSIGLEDALRLAIRNKNNVDAMLVGTLTLDSLSNDVKEEVVLFARKEMNIARERERLEKMELERIQREREMRERIQRGLREKEKEREMKVEVREKDIIDPL